MKLNSFLLSLVANLFFASTLAGAAEVDMAAPNCALSRFNETKMFNLADYQGQVVYLDFWASWCGPCAKSFPFMNELQRKLQGKKFKLIAVNMDEEPKNAEDFLSKFPANFTIAIDPESACAKQFEVQAMPSSYLIGPDGKIRHVHMGFRSGDANELEELVYQLLKDSSSQ